MQAALVLPEVREVRIILVAVMQAEALAVQLDLALRQLQLPMVLRIFQMLSSWEVEVLAVQVVEVEDLELLTTQEERVVLAKTEALAVTEVPEEVLYSFMLEKFR
jgi:hypothetical protein